MVLLVMVVLVLVNRRRLVQWVAGGEGARGWRRRCGQRCRPVRVVGQVGRGPEQACSRLAHCGRRRTEARQACG